VELERLLSAPEVVLDFSRVHYIDSNVEGRKRLQGSVKKPVPLPYAALSHSGPHACERMTRSPSGPWYDAAYGASGVVKGRRQPL
jgi:hypothetical protein